jgi:hypothetical protein
MGPIIQIVQTYVLTFVYLFSKYLWNAYWIPVPVLTTEDILAAILAFEAYYHYWSNYPALFCKEVKESLQIYLLLLARSASLQEKML